MPLCRPLLAALAAVLALALPLGAQGQPSRAAFTGRVVDALTGAPVPSAIVTLRGGHGSAVTDAEGRFSVPGVAEGPYLATVQRLGYGGLARGVKVAAGEVAELALQPDPLVLEGIAVNADRLEGRRRRAATSVRTVEADELARSPFGTVADLVVGRMVGHLRQDDDTGAGAVLRGEARRMAVFVDEVPAFGGLEELEAYDPQDVFLVEAYGNGRQVRVYTNQYMERLAVSGRSPDPVILW